MISRRILRVKVMQVLFAHRIGGLESPAALEKMLLGRIDKTKQLYFVYLQFLIEISQYALVDSAKRANKFIQNDADLNINTDISKNSILLALCSDDVFKSKQKQFSSNAFIDKKLVKDLFKLLQQTDKYVNYCEIKEKSTADEIEILRYIAKKIIGASEPLDELLAEHFMNLEDDHFITLHSLQKKLKEYKDTDPSNFFKSFLLEEDDSEDVEYAKDLLYNSLEHGEEIDHIIQPRLKNWDMDRVAMLDVILLKLTICEFLYFPYIPLKVSLNEYIDISKEYSTSKSKDFINGILDKTMKILADEGKIKKLGRGLINN
jgi:N utilization substance protein B